MRVRITPEYPGLVISEDGRVQGPTKIWSGPKPDAAGYHRVSIWRDGRRHLIRTHVIVCTAFHGPQPGPGYQVAHGNGDNTDNRAANLRWATQADNNADKMIHGTFVSGFSRLTRDEVRELRKDWAEGVWETYVEAAGYYQVHPETISRIIRHLTWRYL